MGEPDSGGIITARNVDLSSCDRELVQYPEAIQPHGAMLTVDEQSDRVLHASANCAAFIGKPPETVIGAPIASVLGPGWRELIGSLHRMPLDSGPVNIARESFLSSDQGWHLFAHRCGGLIILEFENAEPETAGTTSNLYSEVRADLAALQATESVQAFFDLAVERIRAFTGYDRVMAYRFAEDGSGQVIAEARRDDLEPYLGLHYPATDIPAPARRLFALSWVRHLPDVGYTPVPLLAANSPLVTGPVDMSFASLRSVSVMYTGYLKNMGVQSTLVMPLVKEGRLWGLISAMHHAAPRHISHQMRMAAEFLAHTLSLLMSAKEDAEQFERVSARKAAADELTRLLTKEADVGAALRASGSLDLLNAMIDAGGIVVASGGEPATRGDTPAPGPLLELTNWLLDHAAPVFATDRLPGIVSAAQAVAKQASGVLAVRPLPDQPMLIAWLRPEQIEDVQWAGDPRKPVEISEADGMQRLQPRNSFALWKESVQGRAVPWRDDEKDAATRLATAIAEIVATRKGRIERINRALDASHSELSRYTDVASAELKEHLRGIHHLTTSLRRRQGEVLDEEGRQQVATILKLTQRMDALVDALLDRSRGGSEAASETVDLDAVLDDALAPFARRIAEDRIDVRRPMRLGTAQGHGEWIGEVFTNLIGNAIRYNDKPERWIEIGVEAGPPPRYYVRDNGVGIADADQQLIFQMFHRVDQPEQRADGAGAGLAMTRRIVAHHGGRIWVQSRLGEGSTFYFTLAPEAEHGDA
ncbi:ATP-binding protein [Rhodopseudomonas palustris]|uniref:ATP-binding protein n=1 Tax=Rhodopseudomonas palustris TaxID=1076 RepID=UPI000641F03E|nr:ATP-binding protein [Rhodopseudomonas palustris]